MNSIQLQFGDSGQYIYGDGTDLNIVSGNDLDIQSDGNLTIDSSSGTIGFGTDDNTGAINIGTNASARTITIGADESTIVDANALTIELDAGTGGLVLDSASTADAALTITSSAGGMDISSAKVMDVITSANNAAINILPNGSGTLTLGEDANTKVDVNALAIELDAGSTGIIINSANDLTIDSTTLSIDSTDTTNLTMTADNVSDKTLLISASNSGDGTGLIDIQSDGNLTIDSSSGTIGIGTDDNTGAISIGTNASARTITIGADESTIVDANALTIELDAGTGGLVLDSASTADAALTITSSAGGMDISSAKVMDVITSANNAAINILPNGSGTLTLGEDANTKVDVNALAIELDAGSTGIIINSANDLTIDSTTLSIDSTDTTNLTMTADNVSDKTLLISASNSGDGTGLIDIQSDGNLTIDSSSGTIGIGTDDNTGDIDIGTNASARTITIGNTTADTEIIINSGSTGQVTIGTIQSGTWQGDVIAPTYGGIGTDISSVAKGGLLSGSGSGTFGITTIGTDSYILKADSSASNGISWLETLPVANGGTGTTSLTDKAVLVSQDSGTETINSVTMSTDGQLLIGGSTNGPQASTLTAGSGISITNEENSITLAVSSLAVSEGGTGTTSLTDKAVLVSQDSGTETINSVTMSTDGQLLIGGSTNGPQASTLTAGSGISITNEENSITLAVSSLAVSEGGTGTTSFNANAVLVSQDSGTDAIDSIEMTTNGQLLIGGTSGPQASLLTAGTDITITNEENSITIDCTATSDVRLKKDIISLESGLEKILNLNPVNFRWKKDDEKNNIGLIAQEVENIIPDAVKEYNNIKTISYNMITSTLIKGMQELKYENDYLKKENNLLKDQINNIFSRLNKAGL